MGSLPMSTLEKRGEGTVRRCEESSRERERDEGESNREKSVGGARMRKMVIEEVNDISCLSCHSPTD